jgi:hypothetical protein
MVNLRIDRDALVLDVGDETADRIRVIRHNLDTTVRQGHPINKNNIIW